MEILGNEDNILSAGMLINNIHMPAFFLLSIFLKAQNLEDWNGHEEAQYQQLMMDAKHNLHKIDDNMAKMHQWINLAKASHKSNEVRNTNLLARAYSELTV